jgi:hypothetical protein
MITTDALKYLPQRVSIHRGWSAARGQSVRTLSHWRMDSPSKQLSHRNVRSSSSVRLAAISTRSHRTVLRGRDETAISLQESSLRSLRRTFRHGDASLVGQQVLQEDLQKRLYGHYFDRVIPTGGR